MPVARVLPYVSEEKKVLLAHAMQTRLLTEEEFKTALALGADLFIQNMVSYRPEEKQREFNEAVCQQYRLRAILLPPAQTTADGGDHAQ